MTQEVFIEESRNLQMRYFFRDAGALGIQLNKKTTHDISIKLLPEAALQKAAFFI